MLDGASLMKLAIFVWFMTHFHGEQGKVDLPSESIMVKEAPVAFASSHFPKSTLWGHPAPLTLHFTW